MGDKKTAIKLFESKEIRTAWDSEKEEWYFSIQDVVEALTDSADVKQYIKKMKSRDPELNLNWGTICTLVTMTAADGKSRRVQATDTKGMLRIIQSISSPKAEPFKQWLDNMTNTELVLNMLAEVSTTEISRATNPQGLEPSKKVAQQGGAIAKNARQELEEKTGKSAISKHTAKDIKELDK